MSSMIDQATPSCRASRADFDLARTPDQQTNALTRENGTPATDQTVTRNALRFLPRRVAAGTDIVSEGGYSAPCLIVTRGWAAPYKLLRDGRRQLLDVLMEHDGIRICRDSRHQAFHSIVALTDAHVIEGSAEDLARLEAIGIGGLSRPDVLFAEQQGRMMSRMAILGHGRAAERLASCLLDLWRRQEARDKVDETGACPIPIRQSDLGDAVGLTAVHVCRTLTLFRRLGLLEFGNGRLRMLHPEKVAFIAGTESEGQPCRM